MLHPHATAYVVDMPAGEQRQALFLDPNKAVDFAAWKHGTVEALVRASMLDAALARVADLEAKLKGTP